MNACQTIYYILIVLTAQSCYCTLLDSQRNLELPPVMLNSYYVGQSAMSSSIYDAEVKLIKLNLVDACNTCYNENITANCSSALINQQAFKIDHNETFVVPFATSLEIDTWTRCFDVPSLKVIADQAPDYVKGIVVINQCDYISSLNLEFEHSIPVYNAANSSSFRNGQITSLPRHRDTTELQIVPPMCEETPPQPHVDNDLSGPWINSPSNVLDGNTRTFWRATNMKVRFHERANLKLFQIMQH